MLTNGITVGDLKKRLLESSSEFDPVVFGDKESKKINDKAYADIKKETENYDGRLTKEKKDLGGGITATDNKGMSDLRYDGISQPFKDKVKSQMKGYTSAEAEKLHKNEPFGNASFDNDGKAYKDAKEHADAMSDKKNLAAKSGLMGREVYKNDDDNKNDTKTMYENNNAKKIKMLSFKNTQFLSEGHMMSRIPDEYKTEGNKFIMRDSAKTEYLVEWHANEPKVTKKINMNLVNEEKQRIKELWGYHSPESKTSTAKFRMEEDKSYQDVLNKARQLMK